MSGYTKRAIGTGVVTVAVLAAIGLYVGAVPDQRAGLGRGDAHARRRAAVPGHRPGGRRDRPAPTWVSYYASTPTASNWQHETTYVLPAQHAGARHDLPVRRRLGPAQPVHLAGERHRRRHVHAQRQADAGDRPRTPPRTCSRSRRWGSRSRSQGVADNAKNPCGNAPCSLSNAHQDDHVHVPHAGQGPLPLAVLRALRGGIHRRLRRPDADGRVHGRLHQGRMSATADADERASHFRNVALLWLMATVILTPIVIFVLGPGLPPGQRHRRGGRPGRRQHRAAGARRRRWRWRVLVYFSATALWAFRERDPQRAVVDGPPIRGNSSVQFWWLIVTTATGAVPRRLRLGQAARRRRRRRPGAEPDRRSRRTPTARCRFR